MTRMSYFPFTTAIGLLFFWYEIQYIYVTYVVMGVRPVGMKWGGGGGYGKGVGGNL